MEKETLTVNEVQALKAHLALNVHSVEKSLEFYRRMLGLEPSKVRAGYAKFDVENPPLNLTLNEAPFDERGALSHLGIQVSSTTDVLAVRQRWSEAGLITRDEMQTDCCYATQDKAWVRDPDGNEWEVFVVLEDNLPEVDNAGASACCAPNTVAQASTVQISSPACGCESAQPPVGQAPCCDSQAAKFNITR
ncbi:MAG: VOC family protein [Acidobacteria bacterium]|nr:VOC family protein [Acidobacteriota bacterium]